MLGNSDGASALEELQTAYESRRPEHIFTSSQPDVVLPKLTRKVSLEDKWDHRYYTISILPVMSTQLHCTGRDYQPRPRVKSSCKRSNRQGQGGQ